jgi:hypothetical protein
MANTIPAALFGEIISQNALMAFNDSLLPLSVFSTDFGGEITRGSDTVNVPVYAVDSGSNSFTDYISNGDTTVTNVAVAINKHETKTAHFTDIEVAGTSAASAERLGQQMGAGLAKAVIQDILSLVTAANYSTAAFVGASTAWDSDDVIDVKNVCDVADMPGDRGLVLSDAYYNALLKDTSIKNATNYGTDSGIRAGMIPNLAGFQVWQTGSVPANSENLVGFAANKNAIAIAMRYLQPQRPEEYSDAQMLTDPETGIVLGWRDHYDKNTGKRWLNLEANYGYSVGIAGGLKRMTSA